MKRHLSYFVLTAISLTVFTTSTVSAAAPISTGLNYTFSEDSDGIKTNAWKLATLDEEAPWNLTLYRTHIAQQYKSLNETTVVTRFKTPINHQNNVTFWLGASQNRILNFYSYAAMYDGPLSDHSHFWISHGKESLGTITAYERGVHSTSTNLSVLNNFTPSLYGVIDLKRTYYTDGNHKKKAVFTLTKQLNKAWKLKAGYLYDGADHKATGVYYVPVGEKAAFVGTEWTIPIGQGSLVVSGEKSFFAKNSEGNINRYSAGAEFTLKQLSAGVRYDKSGDYWAHSWNLTWRQNW